MQQVLARKNVQKTKLEAAEMIVDPWNQKKARLHNAISFVNSFQIHWFVNYLFGFSIIAQRIAW